VELIEGSVHFIDVVEMRLVAISHAVKFTMSINNDARRAEGTSAFALFMILILELKRINLFSCAFAAFVFTIALGMSLSTDAAVTLAVA
jgi:hypothetical protein